MWLPEDVGMQALCPSNYTFCRMMKAHLVVIPLTHAAEKKKKMGNGKKRNTKKQSQPREIIKEQEEKKGIRIAVRSKTRNMKYSQLQNNSQGRFMWQGNISHTCISINIEQEECSYKMTKVP